MTGWRIARDWFAGVRCRESALSKRYQQSRFQTNKKPPFDGRLLRGWVTLLLLRLIRWWSARRGQLFQVVLQKTDFDAASRRTLWLGIARRRCGGGCRCIAHADE